MHEEPAVVFKGIFKTYLMGSVEVPVLRGIDLLVRPGQFTVLLGPSGSGKTTLLNIAGCLDRPDSGELVVAGQTTATLNDNQLADFRSENIGFVFQNFNLIPVLTAFENVEYPLVLAGMPQAKRLKRVRRLLDAVGLQDQAGNLPGQMSGGQRQRVAIARALARRPKLIIADEPTANLDSRTGEAVLNLMRRMQDRYRISFLFSSHDRTLMKAADDLVSLKDGVIQSIRRRPSATSSESPGTHGQPDRVEQDD